MLVGSDFGGGVNPLFFGAFPDLEYDSWFTIGAQPGDDDGLNSAFDAALTSMADFNQWWRLRSQHFHRRFYLRCSWC